MGVYLIELIIECVKRASIRTSCAMMTSRVTPPVEDEGVEVDGAEEAGGVAVSFCGCLDRSWASLCRMVATSMSHIMEKCVDSG